ncbi:GyrI-like domain-containing protein [Tamlana sp. 62-3]|uniref:GyrI-like domain-containing protein n=1 Tax=Neotamlana sargassicola TaxID=2883125 RepID=A0A9X1I8V6_9FLAO|nr:GyrI-like domain-containing protein [Tamlana sargassicola]MCB4809412.1 GyrI-like domain-containing protein [Tamlana sargassicola]
MENPEIVTIPETLLVGMQTNMSLTENKTFNLFSAFMPKRKTIKNAINTDVFEICIYKDGYFKNFNPNNTFTKWATLAVKNFENIPENMETFNIESGLYAKFNYKGLPQEIGGFMGYILGTWLPNSAYILDHRPHFNVLGDSYKSNAPASEEAIFIPIKPKTS